MVLMSDTHLRLQNRSCHPSQILSYEDLFLSCCRLGYDFSCLEPGSASLKFSSISSLELTSIPVCGYHCTHYRGSQLKALSAQVQAPHVYRLVQRPALIWPGSLPWFVIPC